MARRARVAALAAMLFSVIAMRSAGNEPPLLRPAGDGLVAAPTEDLLSAAAAPDSDDIAALPLSATNVARTSLLDSVGLGPRPMGCELACRPNFYVVFEAVSLAREIAENQVFATLNTPTGEVLNINDLGFHQEAGMRAVLGARLSRCYVLEMTAMGLSDWKAARQVSDASLNAAGTQGNLFSPFTNFGSPPEVGLDFNDVASIRLISSLDTFELNLRQHLGALETASFAATAIYGFRFLSVDELLEYRTHSTLPLPAGSSNAVDVATDNHLYGFQLGANLDYRVARYWINLEGKAAICHNAIVEDVAASMDSRADPVNAPVDRIREEGSTAFVGHLSAAIEIQLAENWVGRIGYQAIFMDGLALASQSGSAELLHDSSALYHGPIAGLVVAW